MCKCEIVVQVGHKHYKSENPRSKSKPRKCSYIKYAPQNNKTTGTTSLKPGTMIQSKAIWLNTPPHRTPRANKSAHWEPSHMTIISRTSTLHFEYVYQVSLQSVKKWKLCKKFALKLSD